VAVCVAQADPVLGTTQIQPDAVFIVPILKTPHGQRLVVLKEFRIPLGDYEYFFPRRPAGTG